MRVAIVERDEKVLEELRITSWRGLQGMDSLHMR